MDVSSWDVSNVTNMEGMFRDCSNLTSLDLASWDTSNVTNMSNMFEMFQSNPKLKTIYVSDSFVVPQGTGATNNMFTDAKSLV